MGRSIEHERVDYNFCPDNKDYGDLPDIAPSTTGPGVLVSNDLDFTTIDAHGGPSHVMIDDAPYLGTCLDSDSGILHNSLALADNSNIDGTEYYCNIRGNDEDGVEVIGGLATGSVLDWTEGQVADGQGGGLELTISNVIPSGVFYNIWIDFNRDGDFDDIGENIDTLWESTGSGIAQMDYPVTTSDLTKVNVYFNVPINALPQDQSTIMGIRVRVTADQDAASGMSPYGAYDGGEVEDTINIFAAETAITLSSMDDINPRERVLVTGLSLTGLLLLITGWIVVRRNYDNVEPLLIK